jgi:hypothetical protein
MTALLVAYTYYGVSYLIVLIRILDIIKLKGEPNAVSGVCKNISSNKLSM